MLYDGDTFEHRGHTFQVRFPSDDDADAPWDREDGHGPVSDWTRRDKRPGELVLYSERGANRFYDFAAAVELARRGWDSSAPIGTTPRKVAAEEARADYERLRRWCADLWGYVGVVVTLLDDDGEPTDSQDALWGVESDAGDYLREVADQCADNVLAELLPSGLDALRAIVSSEAVSALADPIC